MPGFVIEEQGRAAMRKFRLYVTRPMMQILTKHVIILFMGMLFHAHLWAQAWNPYVSRASISPSPLVPAEFEGTGECAFILGNSGTHVIKLVKNQELTMMITLSLCVPAGANPLDAIGGSWSEKFQWAYDSQINTIIGTQKEDIPAAGEGSVVIRFKVIHNSPASAPANGFNVNLQQPPYTNGINLTHDDDVSAYTFVRASDFGDAPEIYGEAVHEVNVQKDRGTGNYANYVYLGLSVDPESKSFYSEDADGDDVHGKDDEDGVIFPDLVRGDTVSVPVRVTVHEGGYGVLYGWIDWNGDGDFTDPGEKVAGPLDFFESGTTTLTLEVPAQTDTKRPVYARFRLGENKSSPTGSHSWGEVEDYRLTILESEPQKESGVIPDFRSEKEGIPQKNNYFSPANESAGSLLNRFSAITPFRVLSDPADTFQITK